MLNANTRLTFEGKNLVFETTEKLPIQGILELEISKCNSLINCLTSVDIIGLTDRRKKSLIY